MESVLGRGCRWYGQSCLSLFLSMELPQLGKHCSLSTCRSLGNHSQHGQQPMDSFSTKTFYQWHVPFATRPFGKLLCSSCCIKVDHWYYTTVENIVLTILATSDQIKQLLSVQSARKWCLQLLLKAWHWKKRYSVMNMTYIYGRLTRSSSWNDTWNPVARHMCGKYNPWRRTNGYVESKDVVIWRMAMLFHKNVPTVNKSFVSGTL